MSISDPRKEEIVAGRSINLALSRRGRESLKKAGIEAQVWLLIYLWIFKSCNSKNSCLGIILGRNFCRQRLSCFLYFWLKLSKVYSAKLCKMWNSWKCISTKFPRYTICKISFPHLVFQDVKFVNFHSCKSCCFRKAQKFIPVKFLILADSQKFIPKILHFANWEKLLPTKASPLK